MNRDKYNMLIISNIITHNVILYQYTGSVMSTLFSRHPMFAVRNNKAVINHSPLKRHEGRVVLDKSSKRLPHEEQALNSTQLATALMYLLWGEYHNLLPDSEQGDSTRKGHGVYSST